MGSAQSTLDALPPFLKWAGGKRWFTDHIRAYVPQTYNRYIEPFLGSAALFFALRPDKAILSDINSEIIDLYSVMRSSPESLTVALAAHAERHSKDYYYSVRAENPIDAIQRSARTLYLNRTCWNGLYRVNKNGQFNVPKGTKDRVVLDSDNFSAYALRLKSADIMCRDFEKTLDQARSGDFIFADPPYTVKHNLNGFLKYNETIFSWDDQIRLREALLRASKRGATVLLSNADHPSIHDLYDGFDIHRIERHSVLAGKASARSRTTEVAIVMRAGNECV